VLAVKQPDGALSLGRVSSKRWQHAVGVTSSVHFIKTQSLPFESFRWIIFVYLFEMMGLVQSAPPRCATRQPIM